jgi:pyridoxine 4-dehydrogenase
VWEFESPWAHIDQLCAWHPAAVPGGDDSARIRAVLDPIAARTGGTVQQVALAWQLHRSPRMLPIPGTTSIAHLKENLASTEIRLTPEDVDTITGLMPEDQQPAGD